MASESIRAGGGKARGVAIETEEATRETNWVEFFSVSSRTVRVERLALYGNGPEQVVELGETVKPHDFFDLDLQGRGLLLTHAEITLTIDGGTHTYAIGTLGGEELLWLSIGIDEVIGGEEWVLAWYTDRL